jgi:hypothetical protein
MKTTVGEQTKIDLDAIPLVVHIDDISATKLSATNISDTKEEKISATKYMNQYKKEKYDIIRFDVKKGTKSLLQEEASKRGMSLTQMIKESLKQYLSEV